MKPQLLNLNLSQLIRVWSKSKDNSYSDKREQEFHDCLEDLFHRLKEERFELMNEDEKKEIRNIIFFFQNSLELLDSNTINCIPFELIECLRTASADWLSDHEQYIILTSYGRYAFVFPEDISLIYHIIESRYGIKFKRKLIQIRLPKYLFRDYLTNVVLYHELGHFVDTILKITPTLTESFFNNYLAKTPNVIDELYHYFPFLDSPDYLDNYKRHVMTNHIREYFSDVFASQYIGNFVNEYLIYLGEENAFSISETHPSLSNRVGFVTKFLEDDSNNFILSLMKEVVDRVSGEKLKKRFVELEPTDFLNLTPHVISEKSHLHSLFKLGWEIWLNQADQFKIKNNMSDELLPSQIYTIINNLIEKSINNFIISDLWIKSKQ